MDVLRIIARRESYVSEKDVKTFYDAFLASMEHHGRVFEVGLLMGYNVKSGHFLADADLGLRILDKGKIHFLPKRIKGRDKVAEIFRKFQEKIKNRD
jgi:heterodisulfide reductase subunit C